MLGARYTKADKTDMASMVFVIIVASKRSKKKKKKSINKQIIISPMKKTNEML